MGKSAHRELGRASAKPASSSSPVRFNVAFTTKQQITHCSPTHRAPAARHGQDQALVYPDIPRRDSLRTRAWQDQHYRLQERQLPKSCSRLRCPLPKPPDQSLRYPTDKQGWRLHEAADTSHVPGRGRALDEHQVAGILPLVIMALLTYNSLIKSHLSAYLAGSIEKP